MTYFSYVFVSVQLFFFKFTEPLAMSTPQQPSTTNANDEVDLENYFSDDDCCEYEYVPSSRLRDSLSDVPCNDDEDDVDLETQQNRRFVRYDFM